MTVINRAGKRVAVVERRSRVQQFQPTVCRGKNEIRSLRCYVVDCQNHRVERGIEKSNR